MWRRGGTSMDSLDERSGRFSECDSEEKVEVFPTLPGSSRIRPERTISLDDAWDTISRKSGK